MRLCPPLEQVDELSLSMPRTGAKGTGIRTGEDEDVQLVCGMSSVHTVAFHGMQSGGDPLAFVARPSSLQRGSKTMPAIRVAALQSAGARARFREQLEALQSCDALAAAAWYSMVERVVTELEGDAVWAQIKEASW